MSLPLVTGCALLRCSRLLSALAVLLLFPLRLFFALLLSCVAARATRRRSGLRAPPPVLGLRLAVLAVFLRLRCPALLAPRRPPAPPAVRPLPARLVLAVRPLPGRPLPLVCLPPLLLAPRGPWAALAVPLLLLSRVPFRLPLLLLLCLLGPLLPLFSPGVLLPPLPLLPLLFPLFPPPLPFLVLVSFLLFALSVSSWSATPATVIA